MECLECGLNNIQIGIAYEPAYQDIQNDVAKKLFSELLAVKYPGLNMRHVPAECRSYLPIGMEYEQAGFCPLRPDGSTLVNQEPQFIEDMTKSLTELKALSKAIDVLAQGTQPRINK